MHVYSRFIKSQNERGFFNLPLSKPPPALVNRQKNVALNAQAHFHALKEQQVAYFPCFHSNVRAKCKLKRQNSKEKYSLKIFTFSESLTFMFLHRTAKFITPNNDVQFMSTPPRHTVYAIQLNLFSQFCLKVLTSRFWSTKKNINEWMQSSQCAHIKYSFLLPRRVTLNVVVVIIFH